MKFKINSWHTYVYDEMLKNYIIKLFWMFDNVGDLRVVPLVYVPLTLAPAPISMQSKITFLIISQVSTWTSQFMEDRNTVFGVMSKFMQRILQSEHCYFTGKVILCPPSTDGWDDAHLHMPKKYIAEVLALTLFTKLPKKMLLKTSTYIYRERFVGFSKWCWKPRCQREYYKEIEG